MPFCEELLTASVIRRPTLHTVWMLSRIRNAGENAGRCEKLLQDTLKKPDVLAEIKSALREYLS